MDELVKQLVEQVKQLVESQKASNETMQILIQRSEQLFKLQEERLNLLPQLVENQAKAIEELEITNAALQESLGDLDAQTDDLAKATSALIEVVTPLTLQAVKEAQAARE